MQTEIPPNLDIPEGVGPHEGHEYELMVSGQKCVAMFSDYIPIEFFFNSAAIVFGHLCHEAALKTIFYLPGHEQEARELLDLSLRPQLGVNDEIETRIGEILGYRHADIQTYILHARRVFSAERAGESG